MSRNLKRKLNNNGSSMLIVVIAMSFISILCALILSVTVTNIQMKTVDQKSKRNFYTVEKSMDEIVVYLEQVTADNAKIAYKEVLEQYVGKSQEELKRTFHQKTIEKMKKNLTEEIAEPGKSEAKVLMERLNNDGLIVTGAGGEKKAKVYEKNNSGAALTFEEDTTNYEYVKIKNIKVTYTKDGYESTIQTDLKIEMPQLSMVAIASQKNIGLPFNEYSLIGSQGLSMETTASFFQEAGNLYGGVDGIAFENISTAYVMAKDIVTPGDLTFSSKSTITMTNNSSTVANFWAGNILTKSAGSKSAADNMVKVTLEGICYVKDDLTLNAPNSSVKIKNSSTIGGNHAKYIGFSKPDTENNAANNSSIIVNGVNSELDLSDVSELSIAGRSFVMKDNKATGGNENQEIQTGESITTKGNQTAYLVPNECIEILGRPGNNPAIVTNLDDVVINTNKVVNGIDLSDYLLNAGTGTGYVRRIYPMTSGTYMVYYYLNDFKTAPGHNIDAYARAYANANAKKLSEIFPVKEIKVNSNTSTIYTAGNYTEYTQAAGAADKEYSIKKDGTAVVTESDYNTIGKNFNAMNRLLQIPAESSAVDSADPEVFNNIIRLATETIGGKTYTGLSSAPTSTKSAEVNGTNINIPNCVAFHVAPYPVAIIKNPVDCFIVPAGFESGLIVATGDVELRDNFEGLILAGGKITVSGSCNLITSNPIIISEIFMKGYTDVNQYFKSKEIYEIQPSTGMVQDGTKETAEISDLISYENWRKN